MFGRKKKRKVDPDRQGAIEDFERLMAAVKTMPEEVELEFSITLATLWKAFLASQGDGDVFRKLGTKGQREYLLKISDFEQKCHDAQKLPAAFAAAAFKLYLAFIAEGDAHANEFADRLEPYLSKGWSLSG